MLLHIRQVLTRDELRSARAILDRAAWADEMKLHEDLFERLAHKLPPELLSAKAAIEARLAA